MKKILLLLVALMSLLSCHQPTDVPYEQMTNYFFRNDATIPSSPLIASSEQFESLFGAAAFMGKNGQPTPVDFEREFVIAVVCPVTDQSTELTPESLQKKDGELVFTYKKTTGDKQSWSMQPVLLIKVDRAFLPERVQLQENQ